jgi:hypothetical protein
MINFELLILGSGIAGHVALTKETVNIKDAYQVRLNNIQYFLDL